MGRVLVTGANGFVGQAVCTVLSEAGYTVRAAVRSSDRLPGRSFEGEVVTVGDIGSDTRWEPALEGISAVVHLAGRVHVLRETFQDPLAEFHKINVLGTERLARMAADEGVQRLIYVSSIGVNGRTTGSRPFTEEDVPAPHNPYAFSKWEAEQALGQVTAETGMEVAILRPPLVYGPGVKANFLRLMKLVNRGVPLPLKSIENRRSLLYVGNLASAIMTCIDHPGAAGKVFLISDSEDVSTPELFSRIASALGRSVYLLPFPPLLLRMAGRLTGSLSALEPLLDSLTVDSSKIRRVLNWRPPYTISEGFRDTASWFKSREPNS